MRLNLFVFGCKLIRANCNRLCLFGKWLHWWSYHSEYLIIRMPGILSVGIAFAFLPANQWPSLRPFRILQLSLSKLFCSKVFIAVQPLDHHPNLPECDKNTMQSPVSSLLSPDDCSSLWEVFFWISKQHPGTDCLKATQKLLTKPSVTVSEWSPSSLQPFESLGRKDNLQMTEWAVDTSKTKNLQLTKQATEGEKAYTIFQLWLQFAVWFSEEV